MDEKEQFPIKYFEDLSRWLLWNGVAHGLLSCPGFGNEETKVIEVLFLWFCACFDFGKYE